ERGRRTERRRQTVVDSGGQQRQMAAADGGSSDGGGSGSGRWRQQRRRRQWQTAATADSGSSGRRWWQTAAAGSGRRRQRQAAAGGGCTPDDGPQLWAQAEQSSALIPTIMLVDVAIETLTKIVSRWKGISWTSRGGMVAYRIEGILGFSKSLFSPHLLPQVSPSEPVENYMIRFEATQPLKGSITLRKVAMRFFDEAVVPIVDEWGCCTGLLHREDCNQLDAPVSTMMRSPPPSVTSSTSVGHVVDLILEKRHPMVIIVNYTNSYATTPYSCRAVGVFTSEQLSSLITPVPQVKGTDLSVYKSK
ncbi:Pentatricopeptide repeat-containing protein, partial [Mucuna pruriens]